MLYALAFAGGAVAQWAFVKWGLPAAKAGINRLLASIGAP